MAWDEVALVLAGSAGPLALSVLTDRMARRQEAARWNREDASATTELYARFLATATQLVADWSDYATLAPDTEEEERKLDEHRDRTYSDLNLVAATVRLTAPPALVDEAEAVLAEVRAAAEVARKSQRGGCTPAEWDELRQGFIDARQRFVDAVRVGGA